MVSRTDVDATLRWAPHGRWRPDDRGQVVPLVAVLVVLAAGATLLLASLGGVMVDRSRARSAADAAALAAALDGDQVAAAVAARNGGQVLALRREGDDVEVRVRVGRAEATSRATAVAR